MGIKTTHFSDISGKDIADDVKPAKILVQYGDARRGTFFLEALDKEAEEIASKGRRLGTKAEIGEAIGLSV